MKMIIHSDGIGTSRDNELLVAAVAIAVSITTITRILLVNLNLCAAHKQRCVKSSVIRLGYLVLYLSFGSCGHGRAVRPLRLTISRFLDVFQRR